MKRTVTIDISGLERPTRHTDALDVAVRTVPRSCRGAHRHLWQIATRFLAPPGQGPPPDRRSASKGGSSNERPESSATIPPDRW